MSLRRQVLRIASELPAGDPVRLKLLAAVMDIPMPKGVREDVWERYLPNVQASLDALKRAGIKVERFDPNNAYYSYAHLRYGRDRFQLGADALLRDDQIKSLARKWKDVMGVVDFFSDFNDVFYDNLHREMKRVLGSSKAAKIAFGIIADILEGRGIKVHS